MSRQRNMPSRAGSMALIALITLVAGAAGLAPTPAAAQEVLTAPLLDRSHARQAHQLVEQWLARGEVPGRNPQADGSPPASRMPVTGLVGVRVTLRGAGLQFGVGEAFRTDIDAVVDANGPQIELTDLLNEAAAEAFAQAALRLHTLRIRTPHARPEYDPQSLLREETGRLLVDVQLAHRLTTIQIPHDADTATLLGTFAWGYHGLRIPTRADQPHAAQWPGEVVARNLPPQIQLTQLLGWAFYETDQLPTLAKPGGIPLHRFEAFHLVRPHRNQPVAELVRGNIVLPQHPMDEHTVDDMASRLGEHLLRRFASNDQVRGTYLPTADTYNPEFASEEETALAAYALARHAQVVARRPADSERAARMRDQAQRTTVRLARNQLQDDANARPAVVAMALLTLLDLPEAGVDMELRQNLTARLFQFRGNNAGFRDGLAEDARPVHQATDALIVAALASLYERTRDPRLGQVVSAEISRLWAATQDDLNLAAMPWFMLAHHRTSHLLATDETAQRRLATRQRGLATMVELLAERQITAPPLLGPSDVIGGFELQQAGPRNFTNPPNPDWRTAQVLTFLSLAIRDRQIVRGDDAVSVLLTAGLASRFLGQLILDEPAAYYARNSNEAVGGVRLALWDNRLGVSPLAMTLLALTELQETIGQFEN